MGLLHRMLDLELKKLLSSEVVVERCIRRILVEHGIEITPSQSVEIPEKASQLLATGSFTISFSPEQIEASNHSAERELESSLRKSFAELVSYIEREFDVFGDAASEAIQALLNSLSDLCLKDVRREQSRMIRAAKVALIRNPNPVLEMWLRPLSALDLLLRTV